MKRVEYKAEGTCVKLITVEVEDNVLQYVDFVGGCPGNLQAIKRLVEGMNIDKIIALLGDVNCGNKPNSCARQLCKALELARES